MLGNTTKRGGASFAGGHGEGLKVGALALVRASHSVQMDTSTQRWCFELEEGHLQVAVSHAAEVEAD